MDIDQIWVRFRQFRPHQTRSLLKWGAIRPDFATKSTNHDQNPESAKFGTILFEGDHHGPDSTRTVPMSANFGRISTTIGPPRAANDSKLGTLIEQCSVGWNLCHWLRKFLADAPPELRRRPTRIASSALRSSGSQSTQLRKWKHAPPQSAAERAPARAISDARAAVARAHAGAAATVRAQETSQHSPFPNARRALGSHDEARISKRAPTLEQEKPSHTEASAIQKRAALGRIGKRRATIMDDVAALRGRLRPLSGARERTLIGSAVSVASAPPKQPCVLAHV